MMEGDEMRQIKHLPDASDVTGSHLVAGTKPTDRDKELSEFADRLASQQEDMPPEFQKVVDKNFWELLEESNDNRADRSGEGQVHLRGAGDLLA